MNTRTDIVITGTGLVTCLGLSRQTTWQAMRQGVVGIKPAPALECAPNPDPGSGQAPDLPQDDAEAHLPREARYLRHAVKQALAEAGLEASLPCAPHRVGVMLATTLHGMRAAGRFFRTGQLGTLAQLLAGETSRLALAGVPSLASVGLSATTCNACASGLASIAMGTMLLQSGQYDLIIAGGYDTISEYAFAGFGSLRLISQQPQRPFAKDRTGLKLAEGYGVVVLERADHARARSAASLARIAGVGESSDAYHLSHPHPQGQGAAIAITQAMQHAGITPREVDLIVAHATATPDNDDAEFKAYLAAMGDELPRMPVTAMKSHLGHTLGGAGAVELILACESLLQRQALPVANVQPEDLQYPALRRVTGQSMPIAPRAIVCLSAGFGGANSAAIIAPANAETRPVTVTVTASASVNSSPNRDKQAVITGIGVMVPSPDRAMFNLAQLAQQLASPTPGPMLQGQANEDALDAHLDPRKARRLSRYVKLTLAAMKQAIDHAQLAGQVDLGQDASAILATTHGSASFCAQFYHPIVEQGPASANPLLFAEGVPNAGSAHVSMAFDFHGPCQTLLGTRTAGLDALHLARLGIEAGRWRRVLVSAAEELYPLIDRAYENCQLYHPGPDANPPFGQASGFTTMEAGVAMIVEDAHTARQRGATILAHLDASGSITWPIDHPAHASQALGELLTRLHTPASILTSANATWLDRVELLGIRQAARHRAAHNPDAAPIILSSTYGHLAECFSATPLLGLAWVIATRMLPALAGSAIPASALFKPATSHETPLSDVALLASDYHGATTGITIRLPGEPS